MKTAYLQNKILDHITGRTTFTKPTNTFIGLMTAEPNHSGTTGFNEVSGGSYARQQAAWNAAANGTTETTDIETFPSMPATTVKYWGIFDAATNGNLLEYYPFTDPLIVPATTALTIQAGNLILREV